MLRIYILCLILLSFLVLGCEREETTGSAENDTPAVQSQPPLPLVVVVEASAQTIRPRFEFPVTIEPIELAEMRPQVAGVVKHRHFTPGQFVDEGDLLIELDEADYQAKLVEIRALIAQAEANAAEAEVNFSRAEKLRPDGLISQQVYDAAQADNISAKGLVDQLQAQFKIADLDLSYTKIRAPFSGKISNTHYAIGDYVAPGSPEPLFELVKIDQVYALATVDIKVYERFILKRVSMEERGKKIPELELYLILATGNKYPYKGSFESWDNIALGRSGTIAARARFPNPDGLLLPGHNLTIVGEFVDEVEGILIPQKAVSMDQQGHYVLKVDENSTIVRQNIEVGIRHGKDWTVARGLQEGERVIVEGLQKVRPGEKAEVQTIQQMQ